MLLSSDPVTFRHLHSTPACQFTFALPKYPFLSIYPVSSFPNSRSASIFFFFCLILPPSLGPCFSYRYLPVHPFFLFYLLFFSCSPLFPCFPSISSHPSFSHLSTPAPPSFPAFLCHACTLILPKFPYSFSACTSILPFLPLYLLSSFLLPALMSHLLLPPSLPCHISRSRYES